ncbi:MAG: Smr/MutS family protein [Acidobacteria bacterium]|nr:Smr/MutS family protein [Acidobacteriota bacterium]
MPPSLLQWLGRKWLALRPAPRAPAPALDQFETSLTHAPEAGAVEDDADESDFFPEPVRLEIKDVFDLHSFAPRDVERVVVEYLEEARRAGFRSVRIIHGKGRGVQRRLVQDILARTPFIRDWADAPPQSGGWGATVAHFTSQNTEKNDERGTMNAER